MPNHRTWIELDEKALSNNINALRALLPRGTRFCAVVKANAYGHGQKEIVHIAARQGVDAFAVDAIDDALTLRALLPSALILTLGYVMHDRLEEAVRERIDLTVYDRETICAIEAAAAKTATHVSVHVKVETGTYRQGIGMKDLPELLETMDQSPHVKLVGLSTHFANLEDSADTHFATMQWERFQEALLVVRAAKFEPAWIHCACSAGIILYPDTHGTLVRGGISMYGLWPSSHNQLTAIKYMIKCDLTPVLRWKTRIAQVKSLPAGIPVGYGLTEITKRPTRLAILPVGYWDGYDRALSSCGEVLVAGNRCKIMGRICMNMMMVDVGAIPNVAREQEVVLVGQSGRHHIKAEELAAKIGTISYEVLTHINAALPRLIV